MKLYRVVNPNGKGFYQSYNGTPPVQYWYPILKYCDNESLELFINTVHPYIDPKEYDSKLLFAFSTVEDLLMWFPPAILEQMIGDVVEIEIDSLYVELKSKQCLYDPEHVISTKTLDKTLFYKDISFPTNSRWIWK